MASFIALLHAQNLGQSQLRGKLTLNINFFQRGLDKDNKRHSSDNLATHHRSIPPCGIRFNKSAMNLVLEYPAIKAQKHFCFFSKSGMLGIMSPQNFPLRPQHRIPSCHATL